MNTEQKILELDHVWKSFTIDGEQVAAVEDISFTVRPGEFISIIGASGCGKSTLLRMIGGLEAPSGGEIRSNGRLVHAPSVDRGMIFQEPRLFPWLSVAQNVAFGITGTCGKAEQARRVEEHLALVGLTGFENAKPNQLSGGMQQRVSIARALINRPSILLLDEPFGALDAFTKINMQHETLRIWERERTTMILVTHDIDEAVYLGDKVVVMSSRPGTIKKITEVPFGKPRERNSEAFTDLRRSIYAEFMEGVSSPIEYQI